MHRLDQGMLWPADVFEQIAQEHQERASFAEIVRCVDWGGIAWQSHDFTGSALQEVGVPRAYQHAVDEARTRTAREGFFDERPDVLQHWQLQRTWIRAPILLRGELLQSALEYELIVGFTRLGNLLGALDRGELAESVLHRVWIGEPA
jgi:hypothetical protein